MILVIRESRNMVFPSSVDCVYVPMMPVRQLDFNSKFMVVKTSQKLARE